MEKIKNVIDEVKDKATIDEVLKDYRNAKG